MRAGYTGHPGMRTVRDLKHLGQERIFDNDIISSPNTILITKILLRWRRY